MILNWEGGELGYIGLQPLIRGWKVGGAAIPTVPASARGNIDFDQIRVSARSGNGSQLLTWNTPPPALHTSTGITGQVAYDAFGNFYWCYSTNSWARMGPGGYSNSF